MSTNQSDVNLFSASPSLSAGDQDAIMTAIATIRQKLPFLTSLTATERNTLAKAGDKSVGFVSKAVEVAVQNPGILPASHTLDDVRNTAQLFQSMAGIKLALEQLQREVSDTTIQLGSNAYAVARTIYMGTKSPIAQPHMTTVADNLGKRFQRKPRVAGPEAESGAVKSEAAQSSAAGPRAADVSSPATAPPTKPKV